MFFSFRWYGIIVSPDQATHQMTLIFLPGQTVQMVPIWYVLMSLFHFFLPSSSLTEAVCVFLLASSAGEFHLGVRDQRRLWEVWWTAGGSGLQVRAWHHPDVLHPVLWDLRLLHGSEEVQDEPVLPHDGEQPGRWEHLQWKALIYDRGQKETPEIHEGRIPVDNFYFSFPTKNFIFFAKNQWELLPSNYYFYI